MHAISCTGANLEEDIFNLVAHDHYERVPHYRDLTPQDEQALLERHMNRVTDTCIPEEEAMRRIEDAVLERVDARGRGRASGCSRTSSCTEILRSGRLEAALPDRPEGLLDGRRGEKNLPMFVPGWEDSTLGNMYARPLHHRRRRRTCTPCAPASST